MFRVTPDNVEQKRTIRPQYAFTQATPYAGYLLPEWDRKLDILPGMVMAREEGDVVTLFGTGDNAANHVPFGLAALFVAPQLGIDEVRPTGTNLFTTWVGDNQSTFEVLAPAFAVEGVTWVTPSEGKTVPLRVTLAGHAEGPGKLTNEAAEADKVSDKVAAHLIEVVGTNKIIVNLQTA